VLDLKQSLFSMFSGGDEQRMMVDGALMAYISGKPHHVQ
jgi:hypothetical protein